MNDMDFGVNFRIWFSNTLLLLLFFVGIGFESLQTKILLLLLLLLFPSILLGYKRNPNKNLS